MGHLSDLTILIAEDMLLHATDLSMAIEDEGGTVLGPAATVSAAMSILESGSPDLAILDVELADAEVFPVADYLTQRDIPFVFYTSRASSGQAEAREYGVPVISKAYSADEAINALCRLKAEAA